MSSKSEVSISQVVNASPSEVWGIIGDPSKLASWHPAIAVSPVSADGRQRSCQLADGGEVEEEILEHNNAERRFKYRIVSSPLPMTGYVSTLRVDKVDGGARVTWESEFEAAGIEPANLEAMIRGLYEAGLGALPRQFEG